jgi:type IV secretory pathway TraG/TraD family ATPase VirD4
LKGKHLLVIGMKREKQDVVAPLLATVLHMIVTRNVTSKREDPLLVAIDEKLLRVRTIPCKGMKTAISRFSTM